jgi:hypothetical protein
VRIGFARIDVSPQEALTAICGSLVALCDDERLFPPSSGKVALLRRVPPMLCRGFPIVRAVNKDKGIIYIVTPDGELTEFNTLVMGRVFVPAALFADTKRAQPNYLGSGILDRLGASTDPLILRNRNAIGGGVTPERAVTR